MAEVYEKVISKNKDVKILNKNNSKIFITIIFFTYIMNLNLKTSKEKIMMVGIVSNILGAQTAQVIDSVGNERTVRIGSRIFDDEFVKDPGIQISFLTKSNECIDLPHFCFSVHYLTAC